MQLDVNLMIAADGKELGRIEVGTLTTPHYDEESQVRLADMLRSVAQEIEDGTATLAPAPPPTPRRSRAVGPRESAG